MLRRNLFSGGLLWINQLLHKWEVRKVKRKKKWDSLLSVVPARRHLHPVITNLDKDRNHYPIYIIAQFIFSKAVLVLSRWFMLNNKEIIFVLLFKSVPKDYTFFFIRKLFFWLSLNLLNIMLDIRLRFS